MRATHLTLLIVSGFVLASCSSLGQASYQRTTLEKQACAETGLTPGTQAFSDCFANMEASIDRSDSVMGR